MPSALKKVLTKFSALWRNTEAINFLLDQWDSYEAEELRLTDIISGFIDPEEVDEAPVAATHVGSELPEEELEDEDDDADDDEEEESDTGIDPEFARAKFTELREQYEATRQAIAKHGRDGADARVEIDKLSDLFKQFRLVPKQFDRLAKTCVNDAACARARTHYYEIKR